MRKICQFNHDECIIYAYTYKWSCPHRNISYRTGFWVFKDTIHKVLRASSYIEQANLLRSIFGGKHTVLDYPFTDYEELLSNFDSNYSEVEQENSTICIT